MIRSTIAMLGLVALTASTQAGVVASQGGRLVAGHDANVLSTYTAREQEARFAVNLARRKFYSMMNHAIRAVKAKEAGLRQ